MRFTLEREGWIGMWLALLLCIVQSPLYRSSSEFYTLLILRRLRSNLLFDRALSKTFLVLLLMHKDVMITHLCIKVYPYAVTSYGIAMEDT